MKQEKKHEMFRFKKTDKSIELFSRIDQGSTWHVNQQQLCEHVCSWWQFGFKRQETVWKEAILIFYNCFEQVKAWKSNQFLQFDMSFIFTAGSLQLCPAGQLRSSLLTYNY